MNKNSMNMMWVCVAVIVVAVIVAVALGSAGFLLWAVPCMLMMGAMMWMMAGGPGSSRRGDPK